MDLGKANRGVRRLLVIFSIGSIAFLDLVDYHKLEGRYIDRDGVRLCYNNNLYKGVCMCVYVQYRNRHICDMQYVRVWFFAVLRVWVAYAGDQQPWNTGI